MYCVHHLINSVLVLLIQDNLFGRLSLLTLDLTHDLDIST